jgi:hypothetical protein
MDKVDRRRFLALAASVTGHAALGSAGGQTVSVADFGADPTGRNDSTVSLENAVSHFIKTGGRTLLFPRGTYKLGSVQHAALSLTRYSGFEVDGSGSTLLMGSDAVCIAMNRCDNAAIHDLTISWDPLPYTQGVVSSSGIGWFEIAIDSGYPVSSNVTIWTIEAYDRSLRNVAKKVLQIGGDKVIGVQSIGASRLRVQLQHPMPIPTGTVLVLRFKGNHEAIGLSHSRNISFRNVTLLSGYSIGYNISYCENMAFHQCMISFPANSNRLLSTNADGMHITNCSGSLAIDQCIFQGTGDDAINVNTPLWRAQPQSNGRGALLVSRNNTPLNSDDLPKAGDQLEVLDPRDLHVVIRESPESNSSSTIAGNIPQGALVGDLNRFPVTVVSHCQFLGNHSRAILAHANLQVSNCHFQRTTLAAILIAPDAYWMEGPATKDIVIDSNSFAGCHYASPDPEGTVTVDIEQTFGRRTALPRAIAQNVRITNNTFTDCYTSAISCRSIDNLAIAGNRVGKTWIESGSQPAIQAGELRNSSITGNISVVPNVIAVRDSESTKVSGNQGFSQQIDGKALSPSS